MPIRRAPMRFIAVARKALPSMRALEVDIQADDQQQRRRRPRGWSGPAMAHPTSKLMSVKAGVREPSAPKKSRPRPIMRQVHGHRDDQQHQHRSAGQRLVGDAVDHRPQRHDEQHRHGDLRPQRQLGGRHDEKGGGTGQRHADVEDQQRRQLAETPFAQQPDRRRSAPPSIPAPAAARPCPAPCRPAARPGSARRKRRTRPAE